MQGTRDFDTNAISKPTHVHVQLYMFSLYQYSTVLYSYVALRVPYTYQYRYRTSTVQLYWYRYMMDDDLSKIPFLHTVYIPVYVLLVLVRVHLWYSFIDCMILVL